MPVTVTLGAYAESVLPYVLRGRQGPPAVVNASSLVGYVWANSLRGELVPVCGSGWSDESAALVCRAVGFAGGQAAALSLNLRTRVGPVLSQVDCGSGASWRDCTALLTPFGRCLRLASAECIPGELGPSWQRGLQAPHGLQSLTPAMCSSALSHLSSRVAGHACSR